MKGMYQGTEEKERSLTTKMIFYAVSELGYA